MPANLARMQKVLVFVAGNFDREITLDALARRAGLSRFQFHRVFSGAMGETPAHLTARLRLSRAAVLLLTTNDSVLDVALACGFQSHETFCRAFRRLFKITPRSYRRRGFAQPDVTRDQAGRHAETVREIGPCLGLFGIRNAFKENAVPYIVSRKEIAPQPVLVMSRRVRRSEIAATIAASLGQIFAHAQQHGIALTGLPFTRYPEMGPGLITMQPGMRIAPGGVAPSSLGDSDIKVETLPGGSVATTLHAGSYEGLPDAYAAIEQWIEAQGLQTSGAPWEAYVNDPSEHPDPAEWKTEVFWPLAG